MTTMSTCSHSPTNDHNHVKYKETEETSNVVSKEEASISLESEEAESPRALADAVELDMLIEDVAIHSTTSKTELNGGQTCVLTSST
jgi:hypothetical protein